jgi:hypothetical protein
MTAGASVISNIGGAGVMTAVEGKATAKAVMRGEARGAIVAKLVKAARVVGDRIAAVGTSL